MKVSWIVLAWLLAPPALASEIPPLVFPAGVGVNIHFTRGHERDLDLIARAGFKWVRMDLGWSEIERVRDTYNWSAHDELTANLERRGLRAIYILDYSNPLYEETVTSRNPLNGMEHRDTASPQHPASVAAFARWAAATARHFRGRHVIWELWNEPNISFWKPKPDVQQYIALALATCQAIRVADPGAIIIGPATSEVPTPFLQAFLGSGVLEYLEAVSVHPYRNYSKAPETAAADYGKVRALIEQYGPTPAKRKLPVISGEWGYATHTKGVSLETQAAYLVRQQLANVLAGVPISIWYDWQNDGPDPSEREHNFGTVTLDLQPKPAYLAIQQMTHELAGYKIARRLEVGNENDFVLVCTKSKAPEKIAFWTTAAPHPVTLKIKRGRSPVVSLEGWQSRTGDAEQKSSSGTRVELPRRADEARLDQDSLTLQVTGEPAYATLRDVSLPRH